MTRQLGDDDDRAKESVQQRKLPVEKSIALFEQRRLFTGPNAAAGVLAVSGVKGVNDVHAFDDLGEWNERFDIVGWRIITRVDEDLSGAAVRNRKSVCHRASGVRHPPGIVRDRACRPEIRNLWIAVNPELRPSILDDTIEARLIVVPRPNEIIKMIGAVRRPVAMNLDNDVALACFKPDLELIRSARVQFWSVRMKERRLRLLKNKKSENENPGHDYFILRS